MNPFPYEEASQIKVDFEWDFLLLEDESLNADFNDYCTVIVGTTRRKGRNQASYSRRCF
ncbi:YxiJ family protein [Paenibacillus cookii]|uniref:YxiJ family protein n=1 Tax=Paenibacillus cookii TaxID=157839 RepID=UPI003570ABA9